MVWLVILGSLPAVVLIWLISYEYWRVVGRFPARTNHTPAQKLAMAKGMRIRASQLEIEAAKASPARA